MSEDEEIAALKRRLAELEGQPSSSEPPSPVAAPAPTNRRIGCGVMAFLGIALLFAIGLIGIFSKPTPTASTTAVTTQSSGLDRAGPVNVPVSPESAKGAASSAVVEATPARENWTYSDGEDKLSGKRSKTACTLSLNDVEEGFPYHSGKAQLCVRSDPRFGLDVFIQLQGTGQILCTSYMGCSLPIRFDSAAPGKVRGAGPSDNSSETVFLKPAGGLISKLKTSKSVVVGLTLYQHGQQSIEWDTAGLKWP